MYPTVRSDSARSTCCHWCVHLMNRLDKSTKDAETILSIGNQKMGTEKHNDEKLAIALLLVGTELIDYHVWWLIAKSKTIFSHQERR